MILPENLYSLFGLMLAALVFLQSVRTPDARARIAPQRRQ